MEIINKRETSCSLKIIELIIYTCSLLLLVYHSLLVTFRYVVDYHMFGAYEQWVTLGLLIVILLYIVLKSLFSSVDKERKLDIIKEIFTPSQILLLAMFFWFALSCFFNEQFNLFRPYLSMNNYFQMEDWFLYDTAVCVLLLFPLAKILGEKRARQMIELLIHIVVIFYSVFTIVCLWHILHLEVIDFPSGEKGGITEDIKLILGGHPNITGMIALTMFCLCCYMALCQETIIKVIYIIAGVAQLVVVYLCNSRAVFLGALVFVIYTGFLGPWSALHEKNVIIRLGISLLITTGVGLAFWYGRKGIFVLFEKITHFREAMSMEAEEMAFPVKGLAPTTISSRISKDIYTVLLDVEGTQDASGIRTFTDVSHRFDIWHTCFALMFYSPFIFLFGVTSVEVPGALIRIPHNNYPMYAAHAHNSILQVGVSLGVPAMLMFIAFLILMAIKSVKVLRGKSGKAFKYSWVVPGIVLCFFVLNMGEAYLVGYYSVISCFFFLLCGWIDAMDRENNNRKAEPSELVQSEKA